MSEALVGAAALIVSALLALLGSVWALRQARALRTENVSVGQRELDQKAFTEMRDELKRQIEELKREMASLRAELAVVRGKLGSTWRYVQSLRSVMRNHRCDPETPLVIPPIPDDIATMPFDALDL